MPPFRVVNHRVRLLARQFGAHRAFLARRLGQEAVGAALLAGGRLPQLPTGLRASALEASASLLPCLPEPAIERARIELDRGRASRALSLLQAALPSACHHLEQPVLLTAAGAVARAAGLRGAGKIAIEQLTALGVRAAEEAGQPQEAAAFLDLRVATLLDPRSAIRRLQLAHDAGELAQWAATAERWWRHWPEFPALFEWTLRALRAASQSDRARSLAGAHRARYPRAAGVWEQAAELASSTGVGEHVDARRCWWRWAVLSPEPWRRAAALRSGTALEQPYDASLRPRLTVEARTYAPGDQVQLRVHASGAAQWAHVLCPVGWGLCPDAAAATSPFERGVATIALRALRPLRANADRPWRVRVVVEGPAGAAIAEAQIIVQDTAAGRVLHIITDDHELHDTRAESDARHVANQLVDKAHVALDLAEGQQARWGFMVEACELRMLDWAADQPGGQAFAPVARAYRELVVDTVTRGHDLGLHLHTFYDPDVDHFAQRVDPRTGSLMAQPDFLFAPMRERRFWHRAHPQVGHWRDPHSKSGSLFRGIQMLESLARLGDPSYQVPMFRAGNYDFGPPGPAARASLFAIADAGIPADSDVPKGRIYTGFADANPYVCRADDPTQRAVAPSEMGLLQLPAEYNVEGDFLADPPALAAYLDARLSHLRRADGSIRPGVHAITTITHTKAINARRGQDNASLDPSYGDWAALDRHLADLRERGVESVRIRDAVYAVADDLAGEPIAIRSEEQIEPALPGERSCWLRYPIATRGPRGAEGRGLPLVVRLQPPAWSWPHIEAIEVHHRSAIALRWTGEQWATSVDGVGCPGIEMWLDDIEASDLELRVQVPAKFGVVAHPNPNESVAGQSLVLHAALPFRRARVYINGHVLDAVSWESRDSAGARCVLELPPSTRAPRRRRPRPKRSSTVPRPEAAG